MTEILTTPGDVALGQNWQLADRYEYTGEARHFDGHTFHTIQPLERKEDIMDELTNINTAAAKEEKAEVSRSYILSEAERDQIQSAIAGMGRLLIWADKMVEWADYQTSDTGILNWTADTKAELSALRNKMRSINDIKIREAEMPNPQPLPKLSRPQREEDDG